MKLLFYSLFFVLPTCVVAQTNWYIDQTNGSNSNTGSSVANAFKTVEYAANNNAFVQPGDTLLIIGEYTNESYDPNYAFSGDINDPQIWTQENSVRINNLNGTPNAYITIRPYDANTLIKGDGANLFRVTNSSYLRIENFTIVGEVDQIPLSTALALQFLFREANSSVTLYRVPPGTTDAQIEVMTFPSLTNVSRPSYTDTRGMYLSDVHHIDIVKNTIHHTPGNGLRVSNCDYIQIIENEVHNTSRKSYSGTHGLVIANATSFDTNPNHKIFILRNEIHHNYNEVYSWAPEKTIITPKIDEGKGISLQRNNLASNWTYGKFLVANNLTYWNGYSGVHTNDGLRMDFVNNTCYYNSYTGTITYANNNPTGNNIGISCQSSDSINFYNNLVVVDASFGGFALSLANTPIAEIKNNLVYGENGTLNLDSDVTAIEANTIIADPLLINPTTFDFHLNAASPAINSADSGVSPLVDFYNFPRDANPDRGAIEHSDLSINTHLGKSTIQIAPNPFNEKFTIEGVNIANEPLLLYNPLGQSISFEAIILSTDSILITPKNLVSGYYFVKIGSQSFPIRYN